MSVSREAIVAEARTWLGVPWRHQGWRKATGCDCVGLIRGVGHALGLIDASDDNPANARFIGYSREPDPALMRAALDLPRRHRQVGGRRRRRAVAALRRRAAPPRHPRPPGPRDEVPGGDPGNETVIHALEGVGKVVEHRLDARWAQRCIAFWRFPGIV